jgi:hypothetical protein
MEAAGGCPTPTRVVSVYHPDPDSTPDSAPTNTYAYSCLLLAVQRSLPAYTSHWPPSLRHRRTATTDHTIPEYHDFDTCGADTEYIVADSDECECDVAGHTADLVSWKWERI